jgi:hypothetical protein
MFLFCLKYGNPAAAMAQNRRVFEKPEVVFCHDFRL